MTASSTSQNQALRLFVALDLPPEARQAAVEVQHQWQADPDLQASYTRPENLHLTLKFLGELPGDELPPLSERLATVRMPPVQTSFGRIGVFSARGPLRILWIHLAGEAVMALQRAIDLVLGDRFEPERQFMSHLTIARIKRVRHRATFLERLDQSSVPAVSFTASAFHLKRSVLSSAGAEYSTLHSYPLEEPLAP